MQSLEERIAHVWHQEVRPLVDDALRCHSTGTPRAAIVATWTAVCADIIYKIYQLAEDGDGKAGGIVTKLDQARGKLDSAAIKIVEDVEKNLLDDARDLELIDGIEHRQLSRLKEDRNLCAHPSLRSLGDVFTPTGDYARAHLVAALDALLVHPPTQGRKAFDRYIAHVDDSSFVGHADYVVQTFARRVKASAWKQIVGTAAKHAMLELPVPETSRIPASVAADRHASCLIAFAQHDRNAAREAVAKAMGKFNELHIDQQLRGLARLGNCDVFTDALDETVCQRIDAYVGQVQYPSDSSEAQQVINVIALAGSDTVRACIPALATKFAALRPDQQARVIAANPSAYFTDIVAQILAAADGYRQGERFGASVVIPLAGLIQPEQLGDILEAWAGNVDCRAATRMPALAALFWTKSPQLHSHPAWAEFVRQVREREEEDWYQYEELAALIGYTETAAAS
ncbi:hypothetical protein OKJ48_04730 [Streptomyces kunmingensis]|uniref:Uncharacterized protein n=1 Tax=Streptomyces kunmingensis TaxID=68225 RepID=A0ABU6C4B1_9ACTN|nr:hypothetical protein [Streptomyces kunmingensis]MEB3959558.1 hypothetical protein [Streptomyces kunmingensis]